MVARLTTNALYILKRNMWRERSPIRSDTSYWPPHNSAKFDVWHILVRFLATPWKMAIWSSMSLSLDNANQMVSTYCVWIVLICRFSLHGHNVSWLIHTPQIGDPCDYPRLKTFIVKRSPSVVGDHSPYDICKSLCCMTGNQTPTNAQECYRSPCLLFGVFDRIWLNNNLNTCLGATH